MNIHIISLYILCMYIDIHIYRNLHQCNIALSVFRWKLIYQIVFHWNVHWKGIPQLWINNGIHANYIVIIYNDISSDTNSWLYVHIYKYLHTNTYINIHLYMYDSKYIYSIWRYTYKYIYIYSYTYTYCVEDNTN